MDNPMTMDDLGIALFQETSIFLGQLQCDLAATGIMVHKGELS